MYKMNRYSKRDDREIKRSDLYYTMVRTESGRCDCGMGRKVTKQGRERKTNKLRTGKNIGAEGAKKVSESLKINTTLTKLDLTGDDKIIERK